MARVSGWYKRQAQIILCVIAAIVTIGLNVNTVAIAERLINDKSVRAEVAQQAAKTAQPPSGSEKSLEAAAKRVEDVGQLGIPFGWHEGPNDPARVSGHLGRTAIGWLLTFLALSLGAPFWFDALSKLARLRTSGVPEGPHETTPRKDDPPAGGATTTVTTAAGAGTSTETVTRTTSTEPGAG
jgi:hypothetical protein